VSFNRHKTPQTVSDFPQFEIGVGMVLRKLITSVSSTCYLEKKGENDYEFHTQSTLRSFVVKFKPGEEFEEVTMDGRKVKSTITFDGDNKLVHVQNCDKPSTILRQFSDTELVVTMIFEDFKAKRFFKTV
jgi:fatty acid-binding protein 3, muscle and heart